MCVQSWAVGNTGERSETELQCGELPCGTFSGIGHISGEKGFGKGGGVNHGIFTYLKN